MKREKTEFVHSIRHWQLTQTIFLLIPANRRLLTIMLVPINWKWFMFIVHQQNEWSIFLSFFFFCFLCEIKLILKEMTDYYEPWGAVSEGKYYWRLFVLWLCSCLLMEWAQWMIENVQMLLMIFVSIFEIEILCARFNTKAFFIFRCELGINLNQRWIAEC